MITKHPYYILDKFPLARRFHEAVKTMPAELAPEYWYELEPNPKRKRIYLAREWDRFVEEAVGYSNFGSLHHRDYTLNAEGFVSAKGAAEGAAYSTNLCALHPKEGGSDHEVLWAAARHFLAHFDVYAAYSETYKYGLKLNHIRTYGRDGLTEESYCPFEPARSFRDYAHAKFIFIGFHWHTVLSEECIADYGIDMEAVRAAAWRVEDLPFKGAAGALYDIRFTEKEEDWESVADVMIDLTLQADAHRFDHQTIFGLRGTLEDMRKGTISRNDTARWREWLYPEGTEFPEA
ncbi:hypothetical protein IV417_15165 [Alphaproteobacteria bacterium KMM 3653]|uniref:Uncharacterized protein n=1 Tax=Harenicola maris TaxID=2841044 RepID=A0AAP2CVZ4_9RHOB|nr:hypothetical protein [Harenicola maris]